MTLWTANLFTPTATVSVVTGWNGVQHNLTLSLTPFKGQILKVFSISRTNELDRSPLGLQTEGESIVEKLTRLGEILGTRA
jgi:hypothetical protein